MQAPSESRQQIRTLDPESIQRVMRSSLYLMEYQVVASGRQSPMTQLGTVQLDAVDVYQFDGHGLRCSERRFHHIQMDRVTDYLLCVPLSGLINLRSDIATLALVPGQYAIMDTSTPFHGSVVASGSQSFSCYGARISAARIEALMPRVGESCNRLLEIRSGPGSLMKSLFELTLKEGAHLTDVQSQQLGTMLLEVVANSVLDAPELSQIAPRKNAQARAVIRAKAFIEARLAQDLDITVVAEHCNMSIRSLQNAFATVWLTPALYIQERRLQRCRAAIRDPRLLDRSLTEIGLSWGFSSPSYFSRVYKKRFGRSPSEERLIAVGL